MPEIAAARREHTSTASILTVVAGRPLHPIVFIVVLGGLTALGPVHDGPLPPGVSADRDRPAHHLDDGSAHAHRDRHRLGPGPARRRPVERLDRPEGSRRFGDRAACRVESRDRTRSEHRDRRVRAVRSRFRRRSRLCGGRGDDPRSVRREAAGADGRTHRLDQRPRADRGADHRVSAPPVHGLARRVLAAGGLRRADLCGRHDSAAGDLAAHGARQ